jgi:hypothetical protein
MPVQYHIYGVAKSARVCDKDVHSFKINGKFEKNIFELIN